MLKPCINHGKEIDMTDSYNERLKRVYDELYHTEPDVVPSFSSIGTFAIGFSGGTVKEMEADPQKEVEYYLKPHETLYTDAVYTVGSVFGAHMAEIVGSPAHFICEDGETIQHSQQMPMTEDDYDALTEGGEKYLFDVLVPRTAKNLQKPYPENKEVIMEFIRYMGGKVQAWNEIIEGLKDKYQRPVMTPGIFAYPAMDVLFDYLRGFQGTNADMRRRPEKVVQACEAIDKFVWKFMGIPDDAESLPEFPPYATMMHIPTFISPKQFEKFFCPTYDRMMDRIHNLGGKCIMFLEGKWANKAEWLNDLPKNYTFGIVEGDDMFEMKKLVGDNICLIGGMPLQQLKYGSLDECKDIAKKLIDECAPGGGYIFGSSRELLTKTDVNWDNYTGTYEFVHEYGRKH